MWLCWDYINRKLLQKGINITVVDTQWFGNYLNDHKNLVNIKEDIEYWHEVSKIL